MSFQRGSDGHFWCLAVDSVVINLNKNILDKFCTRNEWQYQEEIKKDNIKSVGWSSDYPDAYKNWHRINM